MKSALLVLEKHCRNCISTLQFDDGIQFILASLCKSLLAQGKIDEFEEIYLQFENILRDRDSDYWRPPLSESFLSSLSRLGNLLRDKPIDLETVCRFGMDESKHDFYPVYMFHCLVEAVRQGDNVKNRDAEYLTSHADTSIDTTTRPAFSWLWLWLIFLLMRACSYILDR